MVTACSLVKQGMGFLIGPKAPLPTVQGCFVEGHVCLNQEVTVEAPASSAAQALGRPLAAAYASRIQEVARDTYNRAASQPGFDKAAARLAVAVAAAAEHRRMVVAARHVGASSAACPREGTEAGGQGASSTGTDSGSSKAGMQALEAGYDRWALQLP